ncbi:UTP--glucose-1-phosphate uridylyltransferase [Rariglobus hedericola]|uniref:UDPGP type 1 family protein n=1 Tax=Rariglobus hedericola TaxID=2597822 RepID=A0A556QQF6_9BACT|nr:UDPGP type 1 family protein [Rariglobus hedericola]TSJ78853.1 UDPGP type 1 family protein [Rariglobus hedericola]
MAKPPLIEEFERAGQGHVFAFYNELTPNEQQHLLSEAAEIDLTEVDRLTRTLLAKGATAGIDLTGLAPAPYECRPENGGDAAAWASAKTTGEAALKAGRVAAFTVAGGQGTRLGYDGPKGTFPVTPIKQKTLFQVFAEKVRAAGVRYGKPIHWFIMTSNANHGQTESFFKDNGFFGLAEDHVHFFRQGRMPAVTIEGKIMLETKSTIAMSPDGHGGSLRALDRSGALDLMAKEGIDILSYFQVDNPLVRGIDPTFIGWHILRGSEMSSKMVAKAYAGEKVGHFCTQHGKNIVIEYSDLPKEYQEQIDPVTGALRYIAGSIAIHILDTKFIRRMAHGDDSLPFHRADKKIPTVDAAGNPVKPDKANGVKFEMFVFDALPFANNPVVIETRRQDDFSPVKNAEGLDSPKTCSDDQLRQFARWLKQNNAAVTTDDTGLPSVAIEVSPLFGYDEDSFADAWNKFPAKPAITAGLYLE